MKRHAGVSVTEKRDAIGRSAWRLVRTIAIAILVFLVGERIPLPGIDPTVFANCVEFSAGCLRQFSVFAIGLSPLLTVLVLYEIVKLVAPEFGARVANHPNLERRAGSVITALTLGLTALEAYGVTQVWVSAGALDADWLSIIIVVASLVSGTAVLMLLARAIRLPLVAQGGLWLILSIYWARGIFADFVTLIEGVRFGALAPIWVVVALGVLLVAIALILFSATALTNRVEAAGGDPARWSPILIWPPVIAGMLADNLAGFLSLDPIFVNWRVMWVPIFVLFLAGALAFYVRLTRRSYPQEPDWAGQRAVIALIALEQIIICAGFVVAPHYAPIAFGLGSGLITAVLVVWSLCRPMVRKIGEVA